MAKNKNKKKSNKGPNMAELADRHILYQESVQCVESEIDFVDDTYHSIKGKHAQILREDFCGTMNTSCEWIKRRDDNIAHCVDLDNEVLQWGKDNNIAKLNDKQQSRIHVYNQNVLSADVEPVDALLAMNFSYWILKDRKTLKQYFTQIHDKGLKQDGILFLDFYGGHEAFEELEEKTKHSDKGFTYIWDQSSYNPINGECTNYIHFHFKDGSKMRKAFTYTWRLWTLPEILDLLEECQFDATVYWEGTDEEGEGNGIFEPTTVGEADAGWIAYLVCIPK